MNTTQGNPTGKDPVLGLGTSIRRHPLLRTLLAYAAGLVSLFYLVWRVIATSNGVNPFLFWALWGAEFIGSLSLWLFLRDTRHVEPTKKKFKASDALVDILIPTYDESLEILEPTLVGAKKIVGNTKIWVLDDGKRAWVKTLCKRLGIEYVTRKRHEHAKAGNINHVLPKLTGEYLIVLDADHVPFPLIVKKLVGYFVDEKVAVVQTPHNFRNRDSVQHYDHDVHEQSLFFEILLPGRENAEAVFWCGSGAMLRTSALREVGGVATTTITEDLETSIKLERAGYKMYLHNEILLHGLAPHDLASYLIQRYRWARGTIQVLLGPDSPIFGKGFKFKTRVSYLSNFVYYLLPIQQVAYISVLCFTLITGQVPLNFEYSGLLAIWVPQLLLSMAASLFLSNGRQRPLQGTINTWTTSGIYLRALVDALLRRKSKFSVTPKEGIDVGGWTSARQLPLPFVALLALVTSATIRALDTIYDLHFTNPMPVTAQVVSFIFAAFESYILVRMLNHFLRRRQRRNTWRYEMKNRCVVDGNDGEIHDLTTTGMSARVRVDDSNVKPGDEFEVSISIVALDLKTVWVNGTLTVRRAVNTPNHVDVFGSMVWSTERDRLAVMEYCNIVLAKHEVRKL